MTKAREDAETAANNDRDNCPACAGSGMRAAGSRTKPNQVNANGSRTPRPPSCPSITVCDRPMRRSIQRFVRPVASLTLMGSALELVELIIA